MISGILDDYLTSLPSERSLDKPFEMLLRAMEFESVRYTHGTLELGRDFIAKQSVNGEMIQFSFQLKKGRIGQPEWRGDVQGQILQCLTANSQHPAFDTYLRQQVVLVTSGKLTAEANLAINSLNQEFIARHDYLPLQVWDKDDLIRLFDQHGLTGLYQLAAGDLSDYSKYLSHYSSALAGSLDTIQIEQFSMRWVNAEYSDSIWNLWMALETETIGRACSQAGLIYEEIFLHMCRVRALIGRIYYDDCGDAIPSSLGESLSPLLGKMLNYCRFAQDALSDGNGLLNSAIRPAGFVTYPILCSRFVETASLLYLLSPDPETKQEALQLLQLLVATEPGCAHPISDRYAVPIATTSLALAYAGRSDMARQFLINTAVWICDRFEHGLGLASVDADPQEEVQTLLGSRFETVAFEKRKSSLAATVLLYVARSLGNDALILDLKNDFEASKILSEYYCIPDSEAAIRIDSDQIRFIPSVHFDFSETEGCWLPLHQPLEAAGYRFATDTERPIYWLLSVVMKDRFFPTLWRPVD